MCSTPQSDKNKAKHDRIEQYKMATIFAIDGIWFV